MVQGRAADSFHRSEVGTVPTMTYVHLKVHKYASSDIDGFLISVDFGKVKVPIRSMLTFYIPCSKSFQVHFE
jgi:hypothetical protein